MLKKILFFSLSLIALHSYCMNKELQQWVKVATEINVRSTMEKEIAKVSIDDTTTVSQVKSRLFESEGIPVDHQALYPLVKTWKQLWLSYQKGPKLTNDQNIKQVMNTNSDRFLLTLSRLSETTETEINEQ